MPNLIQHVTFISSGDGEGRLLPGPHMALGKKAWQTGAGGDEPAGRKCRKERRGIPRGECVLGIAKGMIGTDKAIWKTMSEIWARTSDPTVLNLAIHKICHKPSATYVFIQTRTKFYVFSLKAREQVKEGRDRNTVFGIDSVLPGYFCCC